jgi:hypothetical protein
MCADILHMNHTGFQMMTIFSPQCIYTYVREVKDISKRLGLCVCKCLFTHKHTYVCIYVYIYIYALKWVLGLFPQAQIVRVMA